MKRSFITGFEVLLIAAVVYCNGLLIQTPMIDSWSMTMMDKYCQTIIEIGFLDQYLKMHPDSWQAYRAKAQAYAVDSHWQAVVTNATKAIEINKDDSVSYSARGHAYYQLGQDELAIKDFDHLIAKGDGNAADYAYRSLANFRTNKIEKAARDARLAVSKDANNAVAYYARALSEYHAGKTKDAFNDAKIANQLDLELPMPYTLLAKIFTDCKKYHRAIATCESGLQYDPTYGATHWQLAIVQDKLGEFQKSIDSCTMALSLLHNKSEVSRVYSTRALSKFHGKRDQDAIEDCQKALSIDPECWEAYEVRRQVYEKLKVTAQAASDKETARKIRSKLEADDSVN